MLDARFPLSVSYVPVSLLRTMRFSHLKSRCLRNLAALVRMACIFGFQGCWTWHASSIGIDLRETAMVTASASEEPTDVPKPPRLDAFLPERPRAYHISARGSLPSRRGPAVRMILTGQAWSCTQLQRSTARGGASLRPGHPMPGIVLESRRRLASLDGILRQPGSSFGCGRHHVP